MAHEFKISILTPEKRFLSGTAEQVIFDTPNGRLGIMADHMPMVAAVADGVMEICIDGTWRTAAVAQGFAEIGSNLAEFFVESVEWAEDIDTVRAEQALQRAAQRMKSNASRLELLRSQAAMARALSRLKAAEKHGGKQY